MGNYQKEARKLRVAVFGDVMIDEYVYCKNPRLSQERLGAMVLDVDHIIKRPGGAANAAFCVAKLGAEVDLYSSIGRDKDYDFCSVMSDCGVGFKLDVNDAYSTTVKKRFIVGNNGPMALRVDNDWIAPCGSSRPLIHEFRKHQYDAVLFSDYSKGVIDAELVRGVTNEFSGITVADPKLGDWNMYRGIDAITPNLAELRHCMAEYWEMCPCDEDIATFLEKLNINALLLTKGSDGCSVYTHPGFGDSNEGVHYKAIPVTMKDATGAGDATSAMFTVAMAMGTSIELAAEFANIAGGLSVTQFGNYQPTMEEVMNGHKQHGRIRS